MRAIKWVFVSCVLLNTILIRSVRADGETADDVADAEENTKSVYHSVRNILVYKMKAWSSSGAKDLSSISAYLGFAPETVKLINGAFTILLARKLDRQSVRVDDLMSAFFYLCDLEHLRDPSAREISTVRQNFDRLQKTLEPDESSNTVYDKNTGIELSNRLRLYVGFTPEPVALYYAVTVRLMKNSWFVEESADATVNLLKRRFTAEHWQTVVESVDASDATSVLGNHVEFLGKIIPDLLGFAYNHVELLIKWRRNGGHLTDDDHPVNNKPVTFFTNFLLTSFDILLKRYFRFRGDQPADQSVTDAVKRLMAFFAPKEIDPQPHAISVHDFRDPNSEYNERVEKLMKDAVKKVLSVFGGENPEEWKTNRTIKVDYNNNHDSPNAKELLRLMSGNTGNAYAFFKVLRSAFV